MWLHPRLEVTGPDLDGNLFQVHGGHGSDEYGNCSYYFRCVLFGVVVFPFPHFQRDVEVPEPGEHPWVDAVYWDDEDIQGFEKARWGRNEQVMTAVKLLRDGTADPLAVLGSLWDRAYAKGEKDEEGRHPAGSSEKDQDAG